MLDTLSRIGKILNDGGVLWAVGASVLLNRYGLADNPNDIDIVVDFNDIALADALLTNMGVKKQRVKTAAYSTRFFYEYIIQGIDIDVMAGLAVKHDAGVFEYAFDQYSVTEMVTIDGVSIPFAALEDWFVIYQVLPNREAKVKMIEDYLMAHGIKAPFLLERALNSTLPAKAKARTENILRDAIHM
jgi:hypothetical protein